MMTTLGRALCMASMFGFWNRWNLNALFQKELRKVLYHSFLLQHSFSATVLFHSLSTVSFTVVALSLMLLPCLIHCYAIL